MSGNAGQGDTRSDSRSDGSGSKLVVTDRLAAEALASAMRNAPEQDLYWARYPWAAQLSGDDFTKRFAAGTPISGFVVAGAGAKPMLVRAVGPALGGFEVTGMLADPRRVRMADATMIAENDN